MRSRGNFASRFNISCELLKEFDEALLFIRGKEEVIKTPEVSDKISKLLKVINPVSDGIGGKLSKSAVISERTIIEIIKERHSREWPTYKEDILKLNSKLSSDRFKLSQEEFKILNDIADALDAECANLFHRMSER